MPPVPTPLRIVFMGTPPFAVPALSALIEAGHDVASVYSQPPRPAGRGQRERLSAVHTVADHHRVPVRTPRSLEAPAEQEAIEALAADVGVVAAYGLILPKPVLDAPRLGCVNVHASLLPRWRGAAPIQHAILAGDAESGVTIMQMDEGLDTGPMIMRGAVPIGPHTTTAELHDTLAQLGAGLLVEALEGLANGALLPVPQPIEGVTYAAKLTRDAGRLDWTRPAAALERAVRALNPWPGTWFEHDGERIRVLVAETAPLPEPAAPGVVLDDRLTIACGTEALRPLSLQRSGRAAMPTAAFLRGHALPSGTRLTTA
ncbi:MAG: methionyl-tRNA formyltransferase [Rhodospirillales bacterium]|nr:methionyl-tRNA formyltransferase [Rhodospirillales bacterium]